MCLPRCVRSVRDRCVICVCLVSRVQTRRDHGRRPEHGGRSRKWGVTPVPGWVEAKGGKVESRDVVQRGSTTNLGLRRVSVVTVSGWRKFQSLWGGDKDRPRQE